MQHFNETFVAAMNLGDWIILFLTQALGLWKFAELIKASTQWAIKKIEMDRG